MTIDQSKDAYPPFHAQASEIINAAQSARLQTPRQLNPSPGKISRDKLFYCPDYVIFLVG